MLPLASGQPDEPRPVPMAAPVQDRDPRNDPRYDPRDPGYARPLPPNRDPRPLPMPADPRPMDPRTDPRMDPRVEPQQPPTVDPRSFGTLSVSIRPSGADIMLDGRKENLTSGDRMVIQLTEGVHHLVITKSGYGTFETDLQIRRGRTLSFDVNLVK